MLAGVALALWVAPSRAGEVGVEVPLDLVEAGSLKLDGIPREWPGSMTPLGVDVRGSIAHGDPTVRVALAYDDAALYVGAEVVDDKLVRTASCGDADDHLTLTLAFPRAAGGFTSHTITLVPGDPGRLAGCVREGSAPLAGARLVEAPGKSPGAYSFEASIPWSALPEAERVRVGLRGAVRYHDADGGPVRVVGTAPDAPPAELPRLPTTPEQAVETGLVRDKGLTGPPRHDLLVDVAGDAQVERVEVRDRYLVVLGPRYRGGREYFFQDLGVDPLSGGLPTFEARDLTGDGRAELVLRKRVGVEGEHREVVEVLHFEGEVPSTVFRHEVGIAAHGGRVACELRLRPETKSIEVEVGAAAGFTADTFHEAIETSFDPTLLPWGTVRSQTYTWNGSTFARVSEQAQAPAAVGALPVPTAVLAPRAPSGPGADELLSQVYELFRRDRRVPDGDEPRFRLDANVAGDAQKERVVVHGRELGVFGKGFRDGRGYAATTLGAFADGRDLASVTARDLDGDGRAELVVRGTARATSARGVEVLRDLLLVYAVRGEVVSRVFAVEVARAVGDSRVEAKVAFVGKGKGAALELSPGRATGWTRATYPFGETDPSGGVEPLVLPWGEAARYAWDGERFTK